MPILAFVFFCCLPIPSLNDENIVRYKIAFIGEVVKEYNPNSTYCRFFGCPMYEFKFIEAYKGVQKSEIIKVTTCLCSIGIRARTGQKWLIVSDKMYNSYYVVSICGQSGTLYNDKTFKNLAYLNSSDFECRADTLNPTSK